MIRPLYDNVLLKKEIAEKQTASGIILTQKEEKEDYARVVALSDCKEVKVHDHVYPLGIKVNDKVMYKKYAGTEIKENGEEYILINVSDILAVIE